MDQSIIASILAAVESNFNSQVEFLSELTSHPSTRGNEQSAQKMMLEAMQARGWSTDVWQIDVKDIAHLPGFSPVLGNYNDAMNVVGTLSSTSKTGRSLILNGHIDVVPEGPHDMWSSPPYQPRIEDGWLYGRGAGDMKAGLVANLFALDALSSVGYKPAGDVFIQSVVEEECTGNGALACLQRGYKADAALIPEPLNENLVSAQVGVIWMQVQLTGIPVHVLETKSGSNAIEAAIPIIAALRALEHRWNQQLPKHPQFHHVDHPLNLNVGRIAGGDWASSVPAWCSFDVRMGIYPDQDISAACEALEACIREAANADAFLRQNPPKIIYHGFLAEGYALADHDTAHTQAAIGALRQAHQQVTGDELRQIALPATTDARFFGLYADTPALVYGPHAESIHGFNERVELDSVRRVTQSIALFIAQWCDLEKA